MGWWNTEQGDDVIGDDSVDTIVDALHFHEKMVGRKPSLQELLDAVSLLLRSSGEGYVSDPESIGDGPIEALLAPPAPPARSRPNPSRVPDDEQVSKLMFILAGAFGEIARMYLDTEMERRPRQSELLESLAFALRARPERVLRDAEGLELLELRPALPPDFRPPSRA